MFLRAFFLLLALALFLKTPVTPAAPENTIERLETFREAVVTVRAQLLTAASPRQTQAAIDPSSGRIIAHTGQRLQYNEHSGAGVIIDPAGIIATNTHIVYGSQRIMIEFSNGHQYPATVLYVSPEHDFSLLKTSPDFPLRCVEFADIATIALGQEVSTIGHSDLLKGTLSGGVISGLGTRNTPQGLDVELIRVNINHYLGDSGGPVFDRAGRLLGLMSSKRLTTPRELFVVPADKVYFAYINLDKTRQSQ